MCVNWNTKIQKGLEKIGLCRNKTYLCGVKINIKSKRLYIMYLTSEKKEELFSQYGKSNKDTGSVESQVALFSYRIAHLTEHLKKNHKDFATQRSLIKLVGKRRALLDYMKKKDIERYREKRDISFPSCAAASDRHPVRTPAYRSPTASADSHRRWRGYRVWWASPAAGACRAPREW